MRKYMLALTMLCLLSACNSGRTSDIPRIDTVWASGINEDIESLNNIPEKDGDLKVKVDSERGKPENLR